MGLAKSGILLGSWNCVGLDFQFSLDGITIHSQFKSWVLAGWVIRRVCLAKRLPAPVLHLKPIFRVLEEIFSDG